MKSVLTIVLLLMMKISSGQADYTEIDGRVQNIDAPAPDSLSKLLTEGCTNELQKVRAIFSWIVQHISYNTSIFSSQRRKAGFSYVAEPDDTSEWKSAAEMTARKVLKKRTAVCDGYAKLFTTLCDYAGLTSEVITGYARGYRGRNKFQSNHSWNAVLIDSVWKLLDVTWASGYVNFSDQFVQQPDDFYFLTPPQQFIYNHYPEDLQWALLEDPPTMSEFKRMPYYCKSYAKYSIRSFAPARGIIEAAIGDTIQIELDVKDAKRDQSIAPDPFFDSSSINRSPSSVFLTSCDTSGNTFIYRHPVNSASVEWLNIMYNGDEVLRYRLYSKEAIALKPKE